MAYYVGKAIRISNWLGTTASPTGGYRNLTGALYDPTTPSLVYRLPGGNRVVVSGGGLVKDGVGLYSLIVTPTADGDAMAAFTSSDGAYSDVITFKVEPAPL